MIFKLSNRIFIFLVLIYKYVFISTIIIGLKQKNYKNFNNFNFLVKNKLNQTIISVDKTTEEFNSLKLRTNNLGLKLATYCGNGKSA